MSSTSDMLLIELDLLPIYEIRIRFGRPQCGTRDFIEPDDEVFTNIKSGD